jgi:hypothetical protein
MNPVHILTTYFSKLHVNIIFPSIIFLNGLLPSVFVMNILNTFFFCSIQGACPLHFIFLDYVTHTLRRICLYTFLKPLSFVTLWVIVTNVIFVLLIKCFGPDRPSSGDKRNIQIMTDLYKTTMLIKI